MSNAPGACKQNPRRLAANYKNKPKAGAAKGPVGGKGRGGKPIGRR